MKQCGCGILYLENRKSWLISTVNTSALQISRYIYMENLALIHCTNEMIKMELIIK
jgi:hypothetical protein